MSTRVEERMIAAALFSAHSEKVYAFEYYVRTFAYKRRNMLNVVPLKDDDQMP